MPGFKFIILLLVIVLILSACAANRKADVADSRAPRITTIKEIPIIGIARSGSMEEMNFPQLWEDFLSGYAKAEPKENELFYGTMFLSPQSDPEKRLFTYMVGVPEGVLPAETPYEKHTIGSGEYAVFTHKGPLKDLMTTYQYIFSEWFPQSGYTDRPGDSFEVYDKRFKDESPDSVIEIWIPIVKK